MKYSLATNSWSWKEYAAIIKVMASNHFTMGEEVRKFEKEFAKWIGSEHAIMVNSGSSANLVALTALVYAKQIAPGSEVIVPAVSWSTTYFPIVQLGLIPVYVDVDHDFNIDPKLAEQAITPKTAAIFAVNLLGMPANLIALSILCQKNGLYLLEDNCEALGASILSKKTGTIGLIGTQSFFYSHHIQTMEGGMITTNDPLLADYCRAIRAHGWVRDLQTNLLYTKGTYSEFEEKFKFIIPGYCVRPLEMSAAIGREQLKRFDYFLDARKDNADTFKELFAEYDIQTESFGYESSWFGFGIVLPNPEWRKTKIQTFKDEKIECRPIVAGNFLNQPVQKIMSGRRHGTFPRAEKIDSCGLFFGNDHRDLRKKLEFVRELLP